MLSTFVLGMASTYFREVVSGILTMCAQLGQATIQPLHFIGAFTCARQVWQTASSLRFSDCEVCVVQVAIAISWLKNGRRQLCRISLRHKTEARLLTAARGVYLLVLCRCQSFYWDCESTKSSDSLAQFVITAGDLAIEQHLACLALPEPRRPAN